MLGFGNKGGVGIRFDIDTTGFCFLCAHFAAHQGAVQKRNEDYETIVQKIQFWTPKEGAVQNSSQVFQHDRVFFCGDLNYRIDGDADTVRDFSFFWRVIVMSMPRSDFPDRYPCFYAFIYSL